MKLFALFCALVVGAFAWAEARGVDVVPGSKHARIPASVRGKAGSYFAYRHYGGGGFRGGK